MASIQGLIQMAEESAKPISVLILEQEAAGSQIEQRILLDKMIHRVQIMRRSAQEGMSGRKSVSGLSGGLAKKFEMCYNKTKLLSDVSRNAMKIALAIAEHNACMGRIVAAPTAGSCGIVPGVLLAAGQEYEFSDEKIAMALFHCAGICGVIAENASISGAQGGCQAECGSAAAMAASALTELLGGSPQMCGDALAFALKFALGLTCDPVAGLVEVPCVKRNASGAINAIAAAELALSGISSAIPADEVIGAMKQVGQLMSHTLKETALAGLAATKTAKKIEKQLMEKRGDVD